MILATTADYTSIYIILVCQLNLYRYFGNWMIILLPVIQQILYYLFFFLAEKPIIGSPQGLVKTRAVYEKKSCHHLFFCWLREN